MRILLPLLIGWLGVWLVASAKRAKFADSARAVANVILALAVLVFGVTVVPQLPRIIAGAMGPAASPAPNRSGTPLMPDPVEVANAVLGMVLPVVGGVVALFACLVLVVLLGEDVLPRAQQAAARREARRAFVHLHTGPLVAPTRERLLDRWGDRPETMTRCVECGRNEWPACRCALQREGYPMTAEPPAPEAPLGKFTLPPWGSADGQPVVVEQPPGRVGRPWGRYLGRR